MGRPPTADRALGANAIVGTRYDGSEVQGGTAAATEVLCYGTAVVVEPWPSSSSSGSSA
ncbi:MULTISPECIES: heavy metal-binding domain-containing protein [unclassified Cyanobium]|uniref:heavy metal-binding domain-containing protein n=1 Tax=unclassified Cyanobium TaxID=2627006 RepID=UPI0020CE491C|nr:MULTISPECIES: heavy metal-binding domain-containing protein [unclassified Cyanobium]